MNRISFKEEKLNELEEINNSAEVLPILKEYDLIDTYETPDELAIYDIPLEEDSEDSSADGENSVIKEFIDPYRIVEIKDYPKTLNIGLAKLKGESVREKVNKKLNPTMKVVFEDLAPKSEDEKEEDTYVQDKSDINSIEKDDMVNNNSSQENTSNDNVIPVWGVPSDISNKIDVDNNSNNLNNTLLWNDIKPVFPSNASVGNSLDNNLEKGSIEINADNQVKGEDTNKSSSNDSTFWIPVSDSKLESDQFPSINVPIQSNFSSERDNFGFPSING